MDAKCIDCVEWCGRCLSEKREKRLRLNRLASSNACSDFEARRQTEQCSRFLCHLAEGLA